MTSLLKLRRPPKGRPSLRERFERFVERGEPDDCWMWLGNSGRYGTISDHGRPALAHRVSYRLFVGDIPDDLQILHSCDNTLCVNPAHLSIGTGSKNIQEQWARGVGRKKRKLTPSDVLAIRASSLGDAQLSRTFNVSPSCIWRTRRGLSGDGVLRVVIGHKGTT